MRIQRKTLVCSMAIGFIAFTLATLVELRIINNFCNITALVGHRDYVITCFIGVAASALISSIISWVSYYNEKLKIINSYFDLLTEINLVNDYYIRWLKQYYNEGDMNIPEQDFDLFGNKLGDLCTILKSTVLLGLSYSPIIFYPSKINIFKQSQKKMRKLIYCQYVFNISCAEVYGQTKATHEFWLRTTIKSEKAEFKDGFDQAFKKLLKMLDAYSELENNRKCLSNAVNKYLKIKEEIQED